MADITMPAKPHNRPRRDTYAISDDRSRNVGSVNELDYRTIVIDVSVGDATNDETAEYVIRVNGRAIRRLTHFQAKRLGILREPY